MKAKIHQKSYPQIYSQLKIFSHHNKDKEVQFYYFYLAIIDELMSNLNETPRGSRIHISLFGKTNSGKSSIINALTGQNTSLVSDFKGTTTDPVYKAMELLPLGPVVFVDTAGFDDEGDIGKLRVEKTEEVIGKTDVALLTLSLKEVLKAIQDKTPLSSALSKEILWLNKLKQAKKPVILVINKSDLAKNTLEKSNKDLKELNKEQNTKASFLNEDLNRFIKEIGETLNIPYVCISAKENLNIYALKNLLISNSPESITETPIIGDKIKAGDKILLVAPQDIQAPKGRLILPQVQVLRDILDYGGIPTMVTLDKLDEALELFKGKPDLVITDSQVFKQVNKKLDRSVKLTSFSILMARYKGDLDKFYSGAKAIKSLKSSDKVLISEACTHHQLKGDIAREKLPTWLSEICPGIIIDNCSGKDFPKNLKEYALVIHCGGCMFNKAEIMNRIGICDDALVPITNFGTSIAEINDILDRVMEPLK